MIVLSPFEIATEPHLTATCEMCGSVKSIGSMFDARVCKSHGRAKRRARLASAQGSLM